MNPNKKRMWAIVALSAAVMAALPASSPAQSPAEVNLWTYYGDTGSGAACVKTAADDYNASQSTYEVKIRNLAFTDFNQQVATAIAGGTTPDLMIVDNPDNARFAASGALADLTVEGRGMGPGRPVPARARGTRPSGRARRTASRSAATPSSCGSTPIWRRRRGSIRRARPRPGMSSPRGPRP